MLGVIICRTDFAEVVGLDERKLKQNSTQVENGFMQVHYESGRSSKRK